MGGDDQNDAPDAPAKPVVKQGAVNPSVADALAAAVSGRRKAVRKSNRNLKPVPAAKAEQVAADAPAADAAAEASDAVAAPVAETSDAAAAVAESDAAAVPATAQETGQDLAGGDAGPVGGGTPRLDEVASAGGSGAAPAPDGGSRPVDDESIEDGPVGGETPRVAEVATAGNEAEVATAGAEAEVATAAGATGAEVATAAGATGAGGDRVPEQDAPVMSDHGETEAGSADGQAAEAGAAVEAPVAAPSAGEDGPVAGGQATPAGDAVAAGDASAARAGAVGAGEAQGPAGGAELGAGGTPAPADGAPVVAGEAPAAAGVDEAAVETTSLAEYRQAQEPGAVVEEPVVPDTADLPPAELRAAVESLLFVSTRPLSVAKLANCLPGTSAGYLEGFLAGLAARYDHERRGWELLRIANGWQLLTRKELHPWVRQLDRKELPTKLTKGALETLAIVAYKQPIARGAIEDIRGVQCGPVLRQLMDMKLVQVSGRDDNLLGRPLLYGTTEQFLQRFGLGGIEDLPAEHEFGA